MRIAAIDALESPALPLLLELSDQGCICRLTERGRIAVRNASRLTESQCARLRQFSLEVKELLQCDDDGVTERRAEFRRQLRNSSSGLLPTFVFKPGLAYRRGECFSCGDPFSDLRVARCDRCTLGMRLALWSEGCLLSSTALAEARIA